MHRVASRRALTLLELLIAIAAASVIALAGTTLLTALTYAASEQRDLRAVVGKSLAVGARLGAEVREAHLILDANDNTLILWLNDTDDDQQPALSEILRIEAVPTDNTLKTYAFDLAATDTIYPLTTDFIAETTARIASDDMTPRNWSRDVAAATFTLDNPDPQLARLLSYRIDFTTGNLTETYANATALRNGGP
ncbi:prepilin-type N-terminal cleavage/methylation domain-containing protein [Mucisphaera sp.]|uniref:prepilin-type N-terminal cleavage/methylation domain-containing protein n=1 Tax=Mucisphaera sp. TaxID=2913024 RepID=UPI003D0FAF3F